MTQSQIVDLITACVAQVDSTAVLFWGTERDFGTTEMNKPTVVMVYPFRDGFINSKITTSLTIKVKKLDSTNSTNSKRKALGDECRDFAFKLWDLLQDLEPAYIDPNSFQGNNEYLTTPKGYTNYSFNIQVITTYSKC
jgi:hypothetical protein